MARMLAGDRITKAVALKLLTAPRVDDERYRRMFVEEARLSMLLGHSNIVQVFDAGSQQGVAYLAMEWVDGLNLDQLTRLARERRLPVPPALAAHVIGEVLQALAYAHTVTRDGEALGLIHRDVSPQNVLVSVSGEVKLADFGIARLAREETSGLFLKGKLRYMPPEQICGVSNAPTVDLYAVGAIFHELLDGVRFRDGDDDPAIYAQIQSCGIPELRRRNVPPVLDALRRRLLEPDPERRLGSAIEGLELLRTWTGYRNETLALARLTRLCLGVTAPRSGVEDEVECAVPAPLLGSGLDNAVAQEPPRGARGWPVGLLGGGLVVALGIAGSFIFGGGGAEPVQSAGPSPVAADEGAAAPLAVAGSALGDMGRAAPAANGSASPSAAPEPIGSSAEAPGDAGASLGPGVETTNRGEDAGGRPRRKEARPPAHVRFLAGGSVGFLYVFVRIRGGGESWELLLEPVKVIELPPGRYRVEYRVEKSDPWSDAGQIRVQAGLSYEAKMSKSGVSLSQS